MPAGGAVRGAAAGITFAQGRTVTAVPDEPAGPVDTMVASDSTDEPEEES